MSEKTLKDLAALIEGGFSQKDANIGEELLDLPFNDLIEAMEKELGLVEEAISELEGIFNTPGYLRWYTGLRTSKEKQVIRDMIVNQANKSADTGRMLNQINKGRDGQDGGVSRF